MQRLDRSDRFGEIVLMDDEAREEDVLLSLCDHAFLWVDVDGERLERE